MELDNTSFEESNFNSNLEQNNTNFESNSLESPTNGGPGKPPKKDNNSTLPVRPLTYNFKGAEIVKKYPKLYAQNLAYIEAQQAHIAKVNKYKTTINKVQSLGQVEQEVALNILKSKKLDLNDINSYDDKDFNTYINAKKEKIALEASTPYMKEAERLRRKSLDPSTGFWDQTKAALGEQKALFQSWWNNEDKITKTSKYKEAQKITRKYEIPIVEKDLNYSKEKYKIAEEKYHQFSAAAFGMKAVKGVNGIYKYVVDNKLANLSKSKQDEYLRESGKYKSAMQFYKKNIDISTGWLNGENDFTTGFSNEHGIPLLKTVTELAINAEATKAYKRVEAKKAKILAIKKQTGKDVPYVRDADDDLVEALTARNKYDLTISSITEDDFGYRTGKGLAASIVFMEGLGITGPVGKVASTGVKIGVKTATNFALKTAIKTGLKKVSQKAFAAEATNLTMRGLVELGKENVEQVALQTGKKGTLALMRSVLPNAKTIIPRLGGLTAQVGVMPATYKTGLNKYVASNTALVDDVDGKTKLLIGQEKNKFLKEAIGEANLLDARVKALKAKGDNLTSMEEQELYEKSEQLNKLGTTIEYIQNLGDNMSLGESLFYGGSETFKETFAEVFTAGLLRTGGRLMGLGVKRVGAMPFLARMGEKNATQSAKKMFSAVSDYTYRPVGNFFNDFWKKGTDLGNKIYQKTGAGKMSQYLAFHSGDNKIFHSLGAEMAEEVHVALLPTYGQDYHENLKELQSANFYLDVLTQTLLMGGGMSGIGNTVHLYKMATDKKYRTNSRELKNITKNLKDLYKNLDDNLDDVNLIEKIAFAAGHTEANVKDYLNRIEKAKIEGDKFTQQKYEKSFLQTLTARALRTGTVDKFKDTLQNMLQSENISDTMRESIKYTQDNIGKYEDIAKKYGNLIHYGDIVNEVLNIDIAEANRKDLLKNLIDNKNKVQESIELFNMHENKGDAVTYEDLENLDNNIDRYNELLEKKKKGVEFQTYEKVEFDKLNHRITSADTLMEMFPHVREQLTTLYLYNKHRAVSYESQKKLNHMIDPKNNQYYIEEYAKAITNNLEDIVSVENAEEIKKEINKDKVDAVTNKKIDEKVIQDTQIDKEKDIKKEGKDRIKSKEEFEEDSKKLNINVFGELNKIEQQKQNKNSSDQSKTSNSKKDEEVKNSTPAITGIKESQSLFDFPNSEKTDKVITEEEQILANLENVNFSPVTYNEGNKIHETIIDDLEKMFTKDIANGYISFNQVLPSLVDGLGSLYVETAFNLIVKAWEKASGVPLENAQKIYNQSFKNEALTELKKSNEQSVTLPKIGPQVIQAESSNTSETDVEKQEETKEKIINDNIDEQIKASTDKKIGEPLVKAAYLSLDYNREEETGDKTDATKTINETSKPYIHPSNFQPGTQQRLEFDFDYLSNPNNNISQWSDIDSEHPVKRIITVKEFIENIFGKETYNDIIDKLRNEETRGEILSNETLLKSIPTKFVINGVDVPGGINTHDWWNAENTLLPIDKGTPRPDLRRVNIEEARILNLETRKLLAQNGYVMMTVQKIKEGYQNEISEEDKENKVFNSIENAFGDNIDAAIENVSFGLVGNNSSPQTHISNGVSTIQFNGETILKEQIINFSDWEKSHVTTGSVVGKLFYIIKTGYKDSQGRDTYSIRSLVSNNENHQEAMKKQQKMIYEIIDLAKQYQQLKREGKAIPERLQKIYDNLKKFGVDLKDDSYNSRLSVYYPEQMVNKDKQPIKNAEGKKQYKQDYKVEKASSKHANNILDLTKYDTVQQFLRDIESGENLSSTTYKHILAKNMHTTYIYSEINDGINTNSVWTSEIQRVIQFDNSHLDNKKLEEKGVSKTSVNNIEKLDREIEAKKIEINILKRDIEEIEDEDLKDTFKEDLKEAEEKLKKLEAQKKVEEDKSALEQKAQKAAKTVIQETSDEKVQVKNDNEEEIEEKVFTALDFNDAVQTLYAKAIEKAGGNFSFNVEAVKQNLISAFDDMVSELRTKGLNQEADFMEENKARMIGYTGEYRLGHSNYTNPNYEYSALEYIDAIFDIKHTEEYSELEDDVESQMVKENYDQESFQVNAVENLSGKAKMLFAGIPDTRFTEAGFGGFSKILPYNNSTEALQQILSEVDNNSLEDIEKAINKKLEINNKEFGFYKHILNRLKELEKNNPEILRQILNMMYQPKTSMIMPFLEGKKVQVLDANSKNPSIEKLQNWKENFKNSPLITKGLRGTYTINKEVADRVYKLHAQFKEKGKESNLDDLAEYLSYFGISLHPETLVKMYHNAFFATGKKLTLLEDDGNNGTVGILANNQLIDLLKANLDKALAEINEGKTLTLNAEDIVNKNTQTNIHLLDNEITSAIRPLVQADNTVSYTPMQSQYIAGKMVNSFEQPKLINNIVKKLTKEDSTYRNTLNKAAITSGSFTVEMLELYPEFRNDFFDVVKISLEALKMKGDKSRDDAGITALSEKDKIVSNFGIFTEDKGEIKNNYYNDEGLLLRKGHISFPAMSDSSTSPVLKTIMFNLTSNNVNADFNRLEDSVLDMLIDKMVRPELLRIAQYLKVNKNSNLEFFDNGAQIITSFESLNKLLLSDTSKGNEVTRTLLELFTGHYENSESYRDDVNAFIDKYREELRNEISDNINDVVNKYISEDGTEGRFVKNELFHNGSLDKNLFDNKYLKSKGKDLSDLKQARMMAYDYTVNFMLHQREIQTLFAGDIANYAKSKSLSKYNKNAILNKELTIDKLIEKNYSTLSKEEKDQIKRDIKTKEGLERIGDTYPDLLSAYDIALNSVNEAYYDTNSALNDIFKDIFSEISNNLSKRLKGQISPGNLFPNSKGGQKYYQIFLKDVDTVSNAIETFMDYHYPGKLEGSIKEIERLRELNRYLENGDTYNKNEEEYREKEEEFETLRKKLSNEYPLIAGYFKNPSTDAQEYATWRDNLNQLYIRGNITKEEFDKIYDKFEAQELDLFGGVNRHGKEIKSVGHIRPENRWKEDEADLKRKAVMQPTKPLYSGIHHETFIGEDGSEFIATRMIYIKSSSFPLLPEIMEKFPNLKNLANNLHSLEDVDKKTGEVKRTVRASYGSANKVGALSNTISMTDMYNPDLLKDNKNFLAQYSTELDRENFFIQQDKPFKSDKNAKEGKRDEINIATQFEKIILGDGINKEKRKIFDSKGFDKELIEEYNTVNPKDKITPENNKISGEDLYKIYNHIYSKLQAIYTEDLKREFGIENFSDMDRKSPESMEKLAEILNGKLSNKQAKQSVSLIYKVIIDNRETNLNADQYREHLINGGGKAIEANFKVPLWLSPDSNKFQSVLGSMINKQFVKKKISGFSAPVASSEGFKIEGFDINDKEQYKQLVNSGLIVSKNFDPNKGLQSIRNEDGTLKFAQVFIANKFKIYNSNTNKYDYVDMSQYVDPETNILDTDKVPEELLSMFSFRIPTSSHQSGTLIEIAGFLPHESADLMIVPSEHTTQIGEDYDIDTRYVYQYNLIKNTDGSISRMKYEHINISNGITYKQAKKDFRTAKENLWNKYFYTAINEGEDTTKHRFKAAIKNDYWTSNQEKLYEIMFLEHALDNHYITNLSNVLLNTEYESEKDSIEGILSDNVIKEYKNRIKELEDQLIPSDNVSEREVELREEYREIKEKLIEDSNNLFEKARIYSNAISQKANEEKVLENNLISMYKSVFSTDNKEVQSLITKVLSTDRAEDTANIIDKVIKESKGDKYFNIFSPHTQDEIMTLGAAGKIGIGEHSNAVTFNSILQQSAYEHKLQKEVTKYIEGIPYDDLEDYNIVLGNFVFDGVLGRVEMNGLRISELGMINQNSATDNQKLQIMAKRNENKHTMSVLKIMHAVGLDRELSSNNEPFMIEGKEVSYASLFLAQPILRRYSELMDKFSSITDKSYGDIEENVKQQLLEEFGENVEWAVNKKTKEKYKGVLPSDKLDFIGKNLTAKTLFDSLVKGDNTEQWYILQAFLDMKKAASDYGDMQKIINIEKDGMGVSYFNIINLKEKLFSLSETSTNKITNAEKLIGDFIYTYNGKDKHGNEVEIPEDYISITDKKYPGRVLYIKPTTPQGHKIVNSIKAGYEMFSSLFPFEQGQVSNMINSLVEHKEFKKENTKTEVELRQDSLNWMKDFLYTGNKMLFNGDVKAGSYDLFFDREGHDSLATYMSKLKANPKYRELFNKPFFKNLEFDLEFKDLPSIIKYVNNDVSSIENLTVHNMLKTMIKSDKPLEKRNGLDYTEADLIRDLFKYSILADQGKGAIGFRKVFDIDLFDENGVSDSLRVYSNVRNSHLQNMLFNGPTKAVMNLTGTKIVNNKIPIHENDIEYLSNNLKFYNAYVKNRFNIDDMYTIDSEGKNIIVKYSTDDTDNAAFVRQVYQHNPQTVKTFFRKHIPSFGEHGPKESKIFKLLKENGYSVQDLDNNDVNGLVYKDKNGDSPSFITLQDTNNKLRLFEHIANGYYEQIPTLGTFGFNEYEVATHRVKSLIPENNPKPYTGKISIGTGVTRSMVESPNTVQLKTLDNIINTIVRDKQHPLRDILLAIRPHINVNNIDLAVVENASFRGVTGENIDEPGIYTIAINSKIFEENQYEVDKVIVEELIHYVTKTSFDKYIDIHNIDFKTGKISWTPKEGTKTPAELITLLSVYANAIKHMAQKYGPEKMQEKYNEHKKSKDSKAPNNIKNQELDIYRTADFHEFLAGIFMKDEEFAKEMANTEYKGSKKTILEKFSNVLIRFLNRVLPNKRTDTISHEVAKTLHTFLLSKPKEKNVERKSKVADKIEEAKKAIQEVEQIQKKTTNVFGVLNKLDQKKKGNVAETSVSNPSQQQSSGNNIPFSVKNIFTVNPIQSVDKKAKSKAKIATQFIGFAEGIAGSSTALYAKQISEQSNLIDFQEEQSYGYFERTRKNASADATIDFGLNQVGEPWTKKAVDNNKKKYIGINTNNLTISSEMVNGIVEDLNSVNAKTLNIAGMGIYNMKNITQEQVDEFVYNLLKQVIESPNLKNKIQSIRTGGQTGFDEAGAKAGQKLGIKTIVLAPKGYIFRNKEGKDIANKQKFINRFSQPNIVNSGNYSSNDVIFVSIGGKRGNEAIRKAQQDRTIREAIKALEAGATLITDNAAYVESSSYNEGEKRLAANLKAKGYVYSEVTVDGHLLGVWNKQAIRDVYEKTLNSMTNSPQQQSTKDKVTTENTQGSSKQNVFSMMSNMKNPSFSSNIKGEVKPGVSELFESNPELANAVYEALGFGKESVANITPKANIPQNLVSGVESFGTKQEANSKAKELLGNNPHSIDMIEAGIRTRTTRSVGEMEKYNVKVGDIVKQFGKSADGTTKNILTRITAIHPKGSPEFLSTWEKEGWTADGVKAIERFKDGAAAIEFEVITTNQITPQQKQQAQQLYSQYLDNILPNSKIAYHGTDSVNIKDVGFDIEKNKRFNSGIGANFYLEKDKSGMYGNNTISVLYNEDRLLDFKHLGVLDKPFIDFSDEQIHKIMNYYNLNGKVNFEDFAKEIRSNNMFNFIDTIVRKEGSNKKAAEVLRSWGIEGTKGTLYGDAIITLNSENIHILGSKQDVEGFKNWVDEFNRGKYLQLASELVNPAIEELDKYLLDFLKKFNVKSKQFEELKSRLGVNALGATDVLNKLIWYVENRNEETLPEEAAHMLVALMGENHPEIKELLLNITNWEEYESIKNQYLPIYKDESKVKIEAIGKLIAKSLVKNYKANGLDNNKLKAALENIINFIKNILDSINVGDAFKYNTSIADKIAINVLSGNKDFIYKIKNTNPNLNAFEEIENNPNAKEIINKFSSNNVKMTGSLAIAGTENIRRPEGQGIHDVDFKVKSFDVFNKEVLPKIPENAVPAHYGWHKKTYSTFAYLIPSKGYRIEVIERKDGFSNGWVTNYKLFNEKNEQIEITQQNVMSVDFFVYKEGVHNKDFDFSSEFIPASLVYEGKMSLGGNSNPYFFSRDKDQEDYVLRNPKSFIPFEKHIYYQLEGFKNWKENQNNSTSFNPNINKTENTLDKLNIFVNPRKQC